MVSGTRAMNISCTCLGHANGLGALSREEEGQLGRVAREVVIRLHTACIGMPPTTPPGADAVRAL